MNNKEQKVDYSKVDFRFSYVFSINDPETNEDIIFCKRDFNINNFDESSLCSMELKECVDDIVDLVKNDLKSKSRVYTWYNYDQNYITQEFKDKLPETQKTKFTFKFMDGDKTIITKIWSGDEYPFTIRNSVDLTNKKYKYESININFLDFVKQTAQRASADKQDLTLVIMKLLSSVCSSFYSKQYNQRVIFRTYLRDLTYDNMYLGDGDKLESGFYKSKPIDYVINNDESKDKIVLNAYTKTYKSGDKEYNLTDEYFLENKLYKVK